MLNLQTQQPEPIFPELVELPMPDPAKYDPDAPVTTGDFPDGSDIKESQQATGLQRYYEILSFGAGLFLQSKSQLPADEVDETDGRDAEDKGGHKGDWGSHSGADKRADEQEVDENKVASINDWLKQNWGK